MSNILSFSRNRRTSVERTDDQAIGSSCCLQDTLTDAYVEITAMLPDLEITSIKGEVARTYRKELPDPEHLQKIKGVRIGPGMLEIIRGLIGGIPDCQELVFMVEECCHRIILSLTKDTLTNMPEDEQEKIEHFSNMVRKNIRLYNRCAAFAPGSRLVEGIEPPK